VRWPALVLGPTGDAQAQEGGAALPDWRQGRVARTGEFSNETLAGLDLDFDLPIDLEISEDELTPRAIGFPLLLQARNPLPEELSRLRGGHFRLDGLGRVLAVGGEGDQGLIGRSFFAELAPWAGDLAARFREVAAHPEAATILSAERVTPAGTVTLLISPARVVGQHLVSLVLRPAGPVPAAEALAEVA
jgi:hypothetical protein